MSESDDTPSSKSLFAIAFAAFLLTASLGVVAATHEAPEKDFSFDAEEIESEYNITVEQPQYEQPTHSVSVAPPDTHPEFGMDDSPSFFGIPATTEMIGLFGLIGFMMSLASLDKYRLERR